MLLLSVLSYALAADVVIENGLVRVTIDTLGAVSIAGNYEGSALYPTTAVTSMTTRVTNPKGYYTLVLCSPPEVVSNTTDLQSYKLHTAVNCADDTSATENITISVKKGSNLVDFVTVGKGAGAVYRNIPFGGISIYNSFEGGMVQMMQQDTHYAKYKYATYDVLKKAYVLGAVQDGQGTAGNVCAALSKMQTTISTGKPSLKIITAEHMDVVLSEFLTECSLTGAASYMDTQWDNTTSKKLETGCTPTTTSQEWSSLFTMSANNHDFPIFVDGEGITDSNDQDDSTKDYIAFMTGVYASPAGNLCTQKNEVVEGQQAAQIATTIATPIRGYEGGYNFFDPDNNIALSAVMFSTDADLIEETRKVIERSGSYLLDNGQLPHHFNDLIPTYQALSGAVQTGPNLFWVLTCLTYAKITQDMAWLKGYIQTIYKAADYLVELIVEGGTIPGLGKFDAMLNSPGALMIDVFIRTNYTSDSNAMVVSLFEELSMAATAIGDTVNATKYTTLAGKISKSMQEFLWAEKTNDHYLTQVNPDGTTRDFVDYDANLMAIAAGIADTDDRSLNILNRIDKGRCPTAHTFVSEKYYGRDDCWHQNIGDSWCGMGRIAWFDALSRKRVAQQLYPSQPLIGKAQLAHFNDVLQKPLRDQVLKTTWMHERYYCNGTQQLNRTMYYFEYPSVQAILTHRIKYGIELGLTTHTIAPFGKTDFVYNVGSIFVKYSQGLVALRLPGTGERNFVIHGMSPSAEYTLTTAGCDVTPPIDTVVTNSVGVASFRAPLGDQTRCTISLYVTK